MWLEKSLGEGRVGGGIARGNGWEELRGAITGPSVSLAYIFKVALQLLCWEYSWTLNNVGPRGADPLHSKKSVYHFDSPKT